MDAAHTQLSAKRPSLSFAWHAPVEHEVKLWLFPAVQSLLQTSNNIFSDVLLIV